MPIPPDYPERVYAGVLGKLIGVYLGRPFENWSHERVERELGEIRYYVNGHPALDAWKRHSPVVQTDDDITGTFTGVAAEHAAYQALKDGLKAPASRSAVVNGSVLAEQVGAQIFIDGWAMVAPGDPELAADLARRAASVSHDGEAIHAAQVVAAMEVLAFAEADLDALIDGALAQVPRDCEIARVIADVREWHAGEPDLAPHARPDRGAPRLRRPPTYDLRLRVEGAAITASAGDAVLRHRDDHDPLTAGAVAFVCEQGSLASERLTVRASSGGG